VSFFSKLLSIKGLKRVASWAWESMPLEDRIAFLDHACHKAGLDLPSVITRTIGETQYRRLPGPQDTIVDGKP
jgi:hypothetical protein